MNMVHQQPVPPRASPVGVILDYLSIEETQRLVALAEIGVGRVARGEGPGGAVLTQQADVDRARGEVGREVTVLVGLAGDEFGSRGDLAQLDDHALGRTLVRV